MPPSDIMAFRNPSLFVNVIPAYRAALSSAIAFSIKSSKFVHISSLASAFGSTASILNNSGVYDASTAIFPIDAFAISRSKSCMPLIISPRTCILIDF